MSGSINNADSIRTTTPTVIATEYTNYLTETTFVSFGSFKTIDSMPTSGIKDDSVGTRSMGSFAIMRIGHAGTYSGDSISNTRCSSMGPVLTMAGIKNCKR